MPARVVVHAPGQEPREVAVPAEGSVEVLPGLRASAAEVPGVVLEESSLRIRVGGRAVAAGERWLLPPGTPALAGRVQVEAVFEDPGTAAEARAVLRAALRGEHPATGPFLVVRRGPLAGRRFPVRDGVLGRGAGADVRLREPSISRAHAQVTRDADGGVIVRDLGSRNGTWLGARRIRGTRRLRPGEPFRAGRTVLALGIEIPGTAAAPAPEPRRRRVLRIAVAAFAAALAAAGAVLGALASG